MTLPSDDMALLVEEQSIPDRPASPRFSNRRAYAQTFSATAATRLFGAVSGILAARSLGPTGRGELAVIVFLPTLLAQIGEVELPRSVAFEASQGVEVPRDLIATSFWLALILGSIQALVLAIVLPLYLPADKLQLLHVARWFMLYLPAAYITATLMGCDQGRGRFGRFSFLIVLPGALYTAFILVVLTMGRNSPSFFALALLLSALITAMLRLGMDGRSNPFGRPDWKLARRLLQRGAAYYLPAVTGFLLARADMLILVRIVPSEAVGLYAVAQAIALGQMGAVLPFVHVGFAAVACEEQPKAALAALARHFRFAQVTAAGMGILAAALTPWAIRTLFGARFSAAAGAAYFLIGATAFWGMSLMLEQSLRAAGHPRVGIVSNLAGLVLLAAVGIPACSRFGINGIASSFLAAEFLNLSVLVGFCVFRLGMPPAQFWAFEAGMVTELRDAAGEVLQRIDDRIRRWKAR
ncbi:MAG: oligosaccharide flippase family protein [Candidatus Acidiferrales bacterium]